MRTGDENEGRILQTNTHGIVDSFNRSLNLVATQNIETDSRRGRRAHMDRPQSVDGPHLDPPSGWDSNLGALHPQPSTLSSEPRRYPFVEASPSQGTPRHTEASPGKSGQVRACPGKSGSVTLTGSVTLKMLLCWIVSLYRCWIV
jgi:hypothetical protein